MKHLLRAWLAAALVMVAFAPTAAAGAKPKGGHGGDHGHGHGSFRALVFSRTAAFRHTDCIQQGTVAIRQLGARHRFRVDATEDAAAFTKANLAKYDVVIFLCTTGDVLNADQQAAFERFIRTGHGYVGIHSASDTEYDWPWYGGLVGAYFRDHPGVPGVNQQFQRATINVEDRRSEATKRLPARRAREGGGEKLPTHPRGAVGGLVLVGERASKPPRPPPP